MRGCVVVTGWEVSGSGDDSSLSTSPDKCELVWEGLTIQGLGFDATMQGKLRE